MRARSVPARAEDGGSSGCPAAEFDVEFEARLSC
jgi:hypothetical protein